MSTVELVEVVSFDIIEVYTGSDIIELTQPNDILEVELTPQIDLVEVGNVSVHYLSGFFPQLYVNQVVSTDGEQTFNLPEVVGNYTSLCINGLEQNPTSYEILGGTTLYLPPALNILTGDWIKFTAIKG